MKEVLICLLLGLLTVSAQLNNIYSFYTNGVGYSFAQFSLESQSVVSTANISYTNNCAIYGIIDYLSQGSSDYLVVLVFNASRESMMLVDFNVNTKSFSENALSEFSPSVTGFFLTSTGKLSYNPAKDTVYLPILNFENNNVTIYALDFKLRKDYRIEFPEQLEPQRFVSPSGYYQASMNTYYSYYISQNDVPTVLAVWVGWNHSVYEFNDWEISPNAMVFILHTVKYAEGQTVGLVIDNGSFDFYRLSMFDGTATHSLHIQGATGTTGVTNGLSFSESVDSDYVIVKSQNSANSFTYTTVDIYTWESSSFTTSNNLPGVSFSMMAA